MITIVYDAENDTPCADGHAKRIAADAICWANAGEDVTLSTSNSLVVYEFRVAVHKKRLDLDKVRICHRDGTKIVQLQMDEHGRFSEWPKNFCDHSERLLSLLLESPEA